jgi:hypothetical protein
MAKKVKVLHRAKEQDSLIAGVCAGLAGYFNYSSVMLGFCEFDLGCWSIDLFDFLDRSAEKIVFFMMIEFFGC